MPRAKALPRYRLHRPSGQAVVTLSGRDFYLGKHETPESHQTYKRLLAQWVADDCKPRQRVDSLLVAELIARFWSYALEYYRKKNGEPTSEIGNFRCALTPLDDLYGATPAAEFGPLALRALRSAAIAKGNWSRATTNKHINRVRLMFRWGVSHELIPPSVIQGLSAVPALQQGRTNARESDQVPPVDDEIVDATIPHLPPIVADMVRLQRLTGMRPAEVCSLRPCDLDRSRDVWLYRPDSHKTEHHGRERVVYFGPKAQCVLLRYLARDASTCCFRPSDTMTKWLAERREARTTPASCGNRPGSNCSRRGRSVGDAYKTPSYRRAIYRGADKAFPHPVLADVPRRKLTGDQAAELAEWQAKHRWAPNRLRHTVGTEVRRAFGLEAAQVTLGHSNAKVTQVYAERDAAKGYEVARAMG
jgi:integrase